jgi:hypothetical protein
MSHLKKSFQKGALALLLKEPAPDAHQLDARGERMINTSSNHLYFSASQLPGTPKEYPR